MVTNNEAVENFLNGKRNLAAYQFSQLIKETINSPAAALISAANCGSGLTSTTNSSSSYSSLRINNFLSSNLTSGNNNIGSDSSSSSAAAAAAANDLSNSSANNLINNQESSTKRNPRPNNDEIAFNYAMVNLFTGCPQRASIIFSDLVKRYPRNPRLWLRLAESMLAAERAKMSEFEHIQQLAYPHTRDHLIKTKNKHILIKVNPNYCQQQIQQQLQLQRETPSNFLVTIKGHLQRALELINEYNDISLLTDDIPNPPMNSTQQSMHTHTSSNPSMMDPQSTELSQQLSYANPYQSISRSDLYHLKNKVQLNLAYICLCMGEPNKALSYTTPCLKSSPQGYEKVSANLYHAEACILASRIDEAIQFLNLEVLNMAKSLSQELSMMNNSNKRVVYGEDMHQQLKSGALATVVTYNMSVAYAAKGEFSYAQRILQKSVQQNKSSPMQMMICQLYIQLQQNEFEQAKKTILTNLPQFR